MSKTVLIAGASGWLGRKIAAALLDQGGRVRLLLRGGAAHPKAGELATLVDRGALIVAGDVTRPSTLDPAMAGVDVIVSALQGPPEIIVDGQRALARAGRTAGVERIFPSDFAVDFSGIPAEQHLYLGWRKRAQAALSEIGLPQTNTYNGAFTEMLRLPFFGLVDWDRARVTHWGSADQPYDFTTTDDTARYVAAAALADAPPDGPFRIAGDTLSPAQIAAAAGRAAGKTFDLVQLGDIEALEGAIKDGQAENPDNPMAWVGLQYHRAMASGAGRLHGLHNGLFPSIIPATVASYLANPH